MDKATHGWVLPTGNIKVFAVNQHLSIQTFFHTDAIIRVNEVNV